MAAGGRGAARARGGRGVGRGVAGVAGGAAGGAAGAAVPAAAHGRGHGPSRMRPGLVYKKDRLYS